MESKPIVNFKRFIGMFGEQAILEGITDHPILGDEGLVRTSRVLLNDEDERRHLIETTNTIYMCIKP